MYYLSKSGCCVIVRGSGDGRFLGACRSIYLCVSTVLNNLYITNKFTHYQNLPILFVYFCSDLRIFGLKMREKKTGEKIL